MQAESSTDRDNCDFSFACSASALQEEYRFAQWTVSQVQVLTFSK